MDIYPYTYMYINTSFFAMLMSRNFINGCLLYLKMPFFFQNYRVTSQGVFLTIKICGRFILCKQKHLFYCLRACHCLWFIFPCLVNWELYEREPDLVTEEAHLGLVRKDLDSRPMQRTAKMNPKASVSNQSGKQIKFFQKSKTLIVELEQLLETSKAEISLPL